SISQIHSILFTDSLVFGERILFVCLFFSAIRDRSKRNSFDRSPADPFDSIRPHSNLIQFS
ncbi:hypothetical protein, partial [Leptospira bandrabouensis]|uniref:hypothetical protein n=1 Tax=Leptospira bandrabouensis TaxID=2484903 RepID=UPI001EE93BA1